MSEEKQEPRSFVLQWGHDFQYTDGVPAHIIVATGNELDEHEVLKVVPISVFYAKVKECDKLRKELKDLKKAVAKSHPGNLKGYLDLKQEIAALRACLKEVVEELKTILTGRPDRGECDLISEKCIEKTKKILEGK